MVTQCDCFCREKQDSDLTLHQYATLIAYCESSKCYDAIKDYYQDKYYDKNLTSIFNENETDLVFSDIED